MLDQMVQFFMSAFNFPNLGWTLVLLAIAIGIVFGAIWLAAYMPPLLKKRWLWFVAIISAFLTWTCIAFIQIPLQNWSGQVMLLFWNEKILQNWLLLTGIPAILISGLVQEGAKLVPVVLFWWLSERRFDRQTGLIAGAAAGVGFGIFEAVWVHNTMFNEGWTLQSIALNGPLALLGFWERFFAVGFHTAVSALAGYGLGRGTGWQFYLLASLLHGILNYSVLLLQVKIFNSITLEIFVAFMAIAVSAAVIWLRWRNPGSKSIE